MTQLFLKHSRLLTIRSKLTSQILSTNRILSAPVEDSAHPNSFLGFLDMLDILNFLLRVYTEEKPLDSNTVDMKLHQWCQDIHKLEWKGKEFADHPVKDCIGNNTNECTTSLAQICPN